MVRDAQKILDQLMQYYEISKPGLPEYHLGCYYSTITSETNTFWVIGSQTHIREAILKAEEILRKFWGIEGYKIRVNTRKGERNTVAARSYPEMDDSKLLGEEGHNVYQHLIGILQWLCCIGRVDIQFAVCSFSRFSACPRKKRPRVVEQVFQYLKDFPDSSIVINHRVLECVPELPVPDSLFIHQYPDVFKEIDPAIPEPFGLAIQMSIFFDSDLAHDLRTHRSCTGIVASWGRHRSHGPASARHLSRCLAVVPNSWLVKQLAMRLSP